MIREDSSADYGTISDAAGNRAIINRSPTRTGENTANRFPYTAGRYTNYLRHSSREHTCYTCFRVAKPPESRCNPAQWVHLMAHNLRPALRLALALSKTSPTVTCGATSATHFPNSERTCLSAQSNNSVVSRGGRDNASVTTLLRPGRYTYEMLHSYSCSSQRSRLLLKPG